MPEVVERERKMKHIAVLMLAILLMVMVVSCRAAVGVGGIYGQEQRNHMQKGKAVEPKSSRVEYPAKRVYNHHTIPRDDYDYWAAGSGTGSNSPPGSNDKADDGTGG